MMTQAAKGVRSEMVISTDESSILPRSFAATNPTNLPTTTPPIATTTNCAVAACAENVAVAMAATAYW